MRVVLVMLFVAAAAMFALAANAHAPLAPRSCHEDTGICWDALIDGNHVGHYIVGVSDEPTFRAAP